MLVRLVKNAILNVQLAGIQLRHAPLAIVLPSSSTFLVRAASISALRERTLTVASFYALDVSRAVNCVTVSIRLNAYNVKHHFLSIKEIVSRNVRLAYRKAGLANPVQKRSRLTLL